MLCHRGLVTYPLEGGLVGARPNNPAAGYDQDVGTGSIREIILRDDLKSHRGGDRALPGGNDVDVVARRSEDLIGPRIINDLDAVEDKDRDTRFGGGRRGHRRS